MILNVPMSRVLQLMIAALAIGLAGCEKPIDVDTERRPAWVERETAKEKVFLREFLTGATKDRGVTQVQFYDGWYKVEEDPKTGGAWRWMGARGIVRLLTKPAGATEVHDMELRLFGWVSYEHIGLLTQRMSFAVNGHILGYFDPPREAFEHVILVPKWLLEHSDWVDFVITVANTVRPNGDWRDLGFATTGFHWKPVQPAPPAQPAPQN